MLEQHAPTVVAHNSPRRSEYETIARILAKTVALRQAVQVELQGTYSTQRVQALFKYHDYDSTLRVLLLLLVTPLPCFLLILIVDAVPLRPISEGIESSQLFFVRAFVSFWIASITAYGQIKHMVPLVPLSNVKIIYLGGIVAGATVSARYALTLVIGYPLPFGIVAVSPVWVFLLLAPLFSWMKRARADPVVRAMLFDQVKTLMCQLALVFIYPTYFHVFTIVPENSKTAFSLLLPVMKLGLRGILARTVEHMKDEVLQVVIFNVDMFSSLFSTYCMQNSPSVTTTCALMAAKVLQMSLSFYDIELVVRRMKALKMESRDGKAVSVRSKHRNTSVGSEVGDERKPSDSRVSSVTLFALVRASTRTISRKKYPEQTSALQPKTPRGLLAAVAPMLSKFGDDDHAGHTKENVSDTTSTSVKYRYVVELRKVLYITEFVMLVNYVEVVIPVIFSAYLFAMYHLPNRTYYDQMAEMDDIRLREAVFNVLLYAALQLESLVALSVVLRHRLQISAFHQLSFVLEKQWGQVQNRMILWVFYNVLQHFGSDYSLHFAWLRKTTTSTR